MENRSFIRFVLINMVIAFFFATLIALDYWFYPVYGSYGFLIFFLLILLLGATGLVACVGIGVVILTQSRQRRQTGLTLTIPFVTILCLWGWLFISARLIHDPRFEQQMGIWLVTEEPVVPAIQVYEATNHVLPTSIEDLQPTYLPPTEWPNVNARKIPAVALGLDTIRVEYQYCPSQENGQATWTLYLAMEQPGDWSDYLHFMYNPDQQYDDVSVMGGWALIKSNTGYLHYC